MAMGAARVIYTFNDLSLYVDRMSLGYVIALVQTERGPLWTPIPVTSVEEYERWFGRTFPGSTDPLVLKMGLMQGAKFFVIRCVHCEDPSDITTMTAVQSTINLLDQGDVPLPGMVKGSAGPFTLTAPCGGSITGTMVGSVLVVTGANDSLKVTVGAGSPQIITFAPGVTVANGNEDQILNYVDEINDQVTDCTATADLSGRITITSNLATDNLVVGAIANDCYTDLGFTATTYAINAGNNALTLAIAGGADQTFILTPGIRSASQVKTDLTALVRGITMVDAGALKIETSGTGAGASVTVSGTARTTLGFDASAHTGSVGTAHNTLSFTAKDPGKWGDSLQVHTYENRLDREGSFDVRITYTNQGAVNEFWSLLNMDPHSERYAPNYINGRSLLVKVADLSSVSLAPSNRPAFGVFALDGGDDGLDGFDDSDWIGDELAQTGIYAADKTDESIDYIIPGSTSYIVAQTLAAYCEDRGLEGYVMGPEGLDPADMLAWRNGDDPYTFEKWNSPHLFLEFGRPDFYDARYDTLRSISSLGALAACLSRNDTYYDYSHAPVGPRRGLVEMVDGLDWNLATYPGFQDEFANNQINSLIMTKTEGAVFWEQYTTLIASSSMQQLNVMRFLLMMKRVFMPVLRTFVEEPNHPDTWKMVHLALEPQLKLWKAQGAIYSYELQTDRNAFFDNDGTLKGAVLNTGLEIQQGIYNARVLIQPTQAIRYFQFVVGVTATGDPYANYEEMHTLPGWVRR